MIKIQEHLNRADADDFLDTLAIRLWNFFNQKLADGSEYKHFSLIKRLDRLINQTNEPGYLEQYGNNDNRFVERQKEFFNYLQVNDNAKLKSLIISRPENLLVLRNEIQDILQPDDLFLVNGSIRQTSFGTLLTDQLFVYNNYRKSTICPELVAQMGLQNVFCPYCNYNRIQVIKISTEANEQILDRAYLDIDHFYPKSQNPFFALSFFNLIPSCHSCNSAEKGDKDFCISSHTNPFHKSYNDTQIFEIDDDYILKGGTNNLKLRKTTLLDDFMDRDLHLSQRYEHTYLEAVNELIQQYLDYQHYRGSSQFGHDYIEVVIQRVPVLSEDILKKEAGKMFRDVFNEIDVFDII